MYEYVDIYGSKILGSEIIDYNAYCLHCRNMNEESEGLFIYYLNYNNNYDVSFDVYKNFLHFSTSISNEQCQEFISLVLN